MTRRSKFGWLEFLLGVSLVTLGVLIIVWPGVALTGLVFIYSLGAIISGITDIVFYVKANKATGMGPGVSLVTGIISILAGLLLLFNPVLGKWIFTLVFSVWFIARGIGRLASHRVIRQVGGKVYGVLSFIINILCIALGIVMLFSPAVSALAFGYMVALGLIASGVGSLVEAFSPMGEEKPSEWELR